MKKPSLETDKVHITILDDNIFRVLIKNDVELNLEDLDRNYFFFKEHMTEKKALFLIIFSKGATTVKGANERFTAQGRLDIKTKEAFVIETLPHRIIGNFYIRYTKSNHPTKIFSNEVDALKWLRTNSH